LKHGLPENNTWVLLGQLVDMEADTRATREEARAVLYGVQGPAKGTKGAYKRWHIRNNLKNIIIVREEEEPLDYLIPGDVFAQKSL
jgi:hypothetical protein